MWPPSPPTPHPYVFVCIYMYILPEGLRDVVCGLQGGSFVFAAGGQGVRPNMKKPCVLVFVCCACPHIHVRTSCLCLAACCDRAPFWFSIFWLKVFWFRFCCLSVLLGAVSAQAKCRSETDQLPERAWPTKSTRQQMVECDCITIGLPVCPMDGNSTSPFF